MAEKPNEGEKQACDDKDTRTTKPQTTEYI